jgi:hypothetical protein
LVGGDSRASSTRQSGKRAVRLRVNTRSSAIDDYACWAPAVWPARDCLAPIWLAGSGGIGGQSVGRSVAATSTLDV